MKVKKIYAVFLAAALIGLNFQYSLTAEAGSPVLKNGTVNKEIFISNNLKTKYNIGRTKNTIKTMFDTQPLVVSSVYEESNITTGNDNIFQNKYIQAAVAGNGRFTIGTTGGDPDNKNDDNKKLIYGHPYPNTSFTTIKIDNSDCIYSCNSQAPKTNLNDGTNTSVMKASNNVIVTQVLSLIASGTEKKDVCEIKYIVQNNDTISHDVGVRVMMDTMLGSNDAAPFRVAGAGEVTTETEFQGENIPDYWQAFDDLYNPSVISQGTFLGISNKPDVVKFVGWGGISNTSWDYPIHNVSNGDSAVGIYWNPKAIEPGEIREYKTYYGLSQFASDLRPPLALRIAAPQVIDDSYYGTAKDYFTVTAYVNNIGSAESENTKIEIVLPKELSLSDDEKEKSIGNLAVGAGTQVSWKVKIPKMFLEEKLLIYYVKVWSDNASPKTITLPIKFLPSQIDSIEISGLDISKDIDINNLLKIKYFNENGMEIDSAEQ